MVRDWDECKLYYTGKTDGGVGVQFCRPAVAIACGQVIPLKMAAATPDWQDLFVDRPRELAQLDAEWHLAKGGEPRLVALIAEQGFGKTRLAQRFFNRISTREDPAEPDGWWPDQLEGQHSTEEVTPVLKDGAAHGGMPFLWWGMKLRDPGSSAVRFSTELTAARETLRSYLRQHVDAQQAAFRKDRMIAAGRKLALDLAVDRAADMLSFGLAGTAKTIAEGSKDIFEAYHSPHPGQPDNVEAILADLRSVCAAPPEGIEQVPICLLIDDYQWLAADLEACRLLDRLCEAARLESWPLLIVVTTWERGWISEANQARLSGWNLPVTALEVGPIGLSDLVRDALPGLTDSQAALLLERAEGNPRSLKYLLANLLDDRRQCFEGRDPSQALTAAGEDYVREQTQDSVVAERFLKSPQPVKTLLAVASLQGVGFAPSLVARTCQALSVKVDEVHFDTAERPYAFIHRRAPTAAEFRQTNVWRAAADWLPNLADPEQARQAFSQAMAAAAREAEGQVDRDAEDELLARERLEDPDVWKRNEGRMALMRLFVRATERREFAVAAGVAERWFESLVDADLEDLRYAFDMRMHALIGICDFLMQGPRRHEVARWLRLRRLQLRDAYDQIEGSKFGLGDIDEPDWFRTTLAYRNCTAVLAMASSEAVAPQVRPLMARWALEVTQLGVDDGALHWRGDEDLMSEREFTRNFSRRKLLEYHDLLITANRLTDDPQLRQETSERLNSLTRPLQLIFQSGPLDGLFDTQSLYREVRAVAAKGNRKAALALFEKVASRLAGQALHEPTALRHMMVADWHVHGLRAIYGQKHWFGFPRKLALRGLEAACRAFRLEPWNNDLSPLLIFLSERAKRTVRKSQIVIETAELLRTRIREFEARLIAETGSPNPSYVPRALFKSHGELCVASARLQLFLGDKAGATDDAEFGLNLAARHLQPWRSLRDASLMWGYNAVLYQIYLRQFSLGKARRTFKAMNVLVERAEQICQQYEIGLDPFAFMRGEVPDLEAQDLAAAPLENETIH